MLNMVGMRSEALRRLGVLVMAGALLSSCSGNGTESTTTKSTSPSSSSTTGATTTSTTTTTTTTTEPPETTTTVDPLARPEVVVSNMNRDSVDDFDPTGDDLYHASMELSDLFNYLEGNPTGTAEEMASLMYEPDYPKWDAIVGSFEELAANPGWHYTDPGIHTLGIDVIDITGDTASIRMVDTREAQHIRDADDVVVREYLGWEPQLLTFSIHRGDDGRWRIADLEPTRPATEEEVDAMVPVEWTGRQP